ncbi:hypothetical protein MUK42_34717 [Musa troglodytarum]|uniref:Uncharacterized protein n=1 Tax=Musa troglodytarum TaxID=320322 RepID=A0A9E7HN29_9LILI|nr:hypothetical protein MUK42_34717 [Musa troglodytarum]
MYHVLQSSLEKTVDRYEKFMKAEKYFDKHNEKEQNHEKGFAYSEGNSKLLEITERFLKTDFAKLSIDGLEQLENDLNDALKWTTSRKVRKLTSLNIGTFSLHMNSRNISCILPKKTQTIFQL